MINGYTLKQAWLSLRKRPGFIATVVATMGTTLGALTCILTLAYLLILQPLPYPEQDRLMQIEYTSVNKYGQEEGKFWSFSGFLHFYKHQKAFDEAAMLFYARNVLTSLPHQPTVPVAFASPELFSMLDVPMALGRGFDEREAVDTNHAVAVLSYDTWQKDFAADPDIINKKIGFKGGSFRVIGVTSPDFIEPQVFRQGVNTGVWFPWDFHLGKTWISWRAMIDRIVMLGKLKPEYTRAQAEQELTPMVSDVWQSNVTDVTVFKGWSIKIVLRSFQEVLLGESGNALYLLLAGVFGLVIIACANITNLFMSRTAEQQGSLAIQAALGAKKSQLLRSLLAETSLLMLASFLLALIISACGFYIMQQYLTAILPRVEELAVSAVTVLFALFFSLLAAVFFAYMSGKMINYRQLNLQLQSSGKGTGIQVSKTIRQILIGSQVAIAMVLVFANMSLFNAAVDNIRSPLGFDVSDTYHASFSVSAPTYPEGEVVRPIMNDLQQELLKLPQVEQVEISYSPLVRFFDWVMLDPRTGENINMQGKGVSQSYFEMIKQPLLEGEFFSNADVTDVNDVLIINDVLAKELNPDGSAVGMTLVSGGGDVFKIIGVVKGAKLPGSNEITGRIYVPTWDSVTKMNLKLSPNQTISREETVEAIKAVTNLYALYGLESLADTQEILLFSQYTTAVTTAVLALITLFLAAIGLYGILSYGTQMRRFEMGTRMAIGAKSKDLIWLLIRENSTVIGVGVLVSILSLLAIYIGFGQVVASYINMSLLPIFILTLAIISLLSLFACYWPLRQFIKQPAIYSLRGSE